ncbi:Vesicle transport protein GOT1 [Sesamum angolense]|uniref:Vesicle transport protein GOT1 n=1 Tax=Sesamum angolense TaxID=2727404 RepID=A0AAE2C4G2_9LAMI|nr:Vesicle transport protein GOT1 [Sesamum angolense]
MGNILFFSGVTLTIGLKSSMQFFMKRSNFKVSLLTKDLLLPYCGFWPTLAVFLQKMPVIGWLFQQPFVRSNLGGIMEFVKICFLIVIVEKEYLCKFSLEKCGRGTWDHFCLGWAWLEAPVEFFSSCTGL